MATKPLEMHGMLMAHWEPTHLEGEINDAIVVKGEIPDSLNGTLFRQGMNPRYRGLSETYMPVTSDGMVHAMRLEGGKAYYKNRWVRTPRFVLEDKCGRAMFEYEGGNIPNPLFDGLAFPVLDKPETRNVPSGTANITAWTHGNRLYALGEQTIPMEVHPQTLETLGVPAWAADLPAGVLPKVSPEDGGVCAHPKNCPVTGEIFWFTSSIEGPAITIGSYNPATGAKRNIRLDMPHMFYPHDWMITRNHIILPIFPVYFAPENPAQGKCAKVWEPELRTKIAVIPRDGGKTMWFDTWEEGSRFSFHPQAAYEKDGHIIAHVPEYPTFPHPAEGGEGSWETKYPDANMSEWDFDLAKGTIKVRKVDDRSIEFPWIDQRFYGSEYRYAFTAVASGEAGPALAFDSVQTYDHKTNTYVMQDFGKGNVVMEPIFVPRSADAPEGDGYLLSYLWHADTNRSDFIILDAQAVDQEPIAVVSLPMRVPLAPHGSWLSAE